MNLKFTHLYENTYHTPNILQFSPKRLCRTAQDVEQFTHTIHTTSLVVRTRDGNVIRTGTLLQIRSWIATYGRSVWIEPNLLALHSIEDMIAFRFTSTPHLKCLATLNIYAYKPSTSLRPNQHTYQIITHNIDRVSMDVTQQEVYASTRRFVKQNISRLPTSIYIDILVCPIQGGQSDKYFITGIHQLSESDAEEVSSCAPSVI